MKLMRSTLSLAIALSMVVLSPGGNAWAQFSEVAGARAASSSSGIGAAGAVKGSASIPTASLSVSALTPSLSVPAISLSAAPIASAVNAALPAARPTSVAAVAPVATAVAAPITAAPGAVVIDASGQLTQTSRALSAPSAESDRVIGRLYDSSRVKETSAFSVLAAALGLNRSFLSKSSKKQERMPDSGDKYDGTGRPVHDDGGIDDLGNPRRSGGEGGPDDRSDPDGGRGGDGGAFFRSVAAPALSFFSSAASGVSARSSKSSKKGTPDSGDKYDGSGRPANDDGGLDELGNPRRTSGEGGPDDRSDPDGGRGGGSDGLFAALPVAAVAATAVINPIVILPLVLVSLVLHEIGHAKMAAKLGDPTATLQGRASFNPLRWASHIDPVMTILLPIATFLTAGFIFGGAKPVPVEPSYFKNPVKDMAKVAFAGPAVNMVLAGAGALAYAGAVAGGLGAVMLGALVSFIFLNSVLAVFNLLPVRPLDGGHILAALLPASASAKLDSFYGRLGAFGMLPIIAIAILGGGFIVGAAAGVTQLLIGASLGITGVQLAGAALPAMAALGLLMGRPQAPPVRPVAAAAAAAQPVDFVVVFSGARHMTRDLHLSQVDPSRLSYVQDYESAQNALLEQVASVGLDAQTLADYNATPMAAYRRINAATIRVDASQAARFAALLRSEGHEVFNNDRRKIITPVPTKPEDADPSMWGAVTIEDNLKITNAAPIQAIAAQRWGKPDMNPWQRLVRRVLHPFSSEPAQPLIGVIDSGADVTHPLLKRVKEVKNATAGPNVDDIGHGSWVTSMVLSYAPWSKNTTHYKTFVDGSASTDDILKALTMAANDGNLVISNSWGDDEGDPEGPDAKMVRKLAEEGHIMVFAAGNAGSGKNTVGAPAIVTYKDATTGAIRVLAVAASDKNKKVAYFSSRGPGSPTTKKTPGYPHRPDLMAVGYNTEGAWPADLGGADRRDPVQGTLKAISGTSMSTPSVAGAIALLMMMFGVTEKGARLDAVVNALMGTLEKTGKNGPDDEGEGFMNVQAAYEKLLETLGAPGLMPQAAAYRRLSSEVSRQELSLLSARKAFADLDRRTRNEMLTRLENIDEPALASARAQLAKLTAENPGIQYQAARPLGRLWMRLTGRAPKD